jgi:hypothetical protein
VTRRRDPAVRTTLAELLSHPRAVALVNLHAVPGPTDDACYEWTGSLTGTGYARVNVWADGHAWTLMAHRVAYQLAHGLLPDGHEVGHSCHDRDASCRAGNACPHRRCCHPGHLVAQSHLDNMRQSWRRRRGRTGETCPHAVTVETADGLRCRTCLRLLPTAC